MTSENLLGLTPVFSELQLVRSENGQVVLNTDKRPARRGAGEDRGSRQLRRDRRAGALCPTIRKGAVRLGLRRRPALRARAAARREDPGDERRPADRLGCVARSAEHLLEQQPLPAGLVPAEEGTRISSRLSRQRSPSRTPSGRSVTELEQGAVAREIREQVERHEDAVR